MLLVAGFYHGLYGLCFDEAIELDDVEDWFVRAADFLQRVGIFFIDGRIIDSGDFSPIVVHPTAAKRLIDRVNTSCL